MLCAVACRATASSGRINIADFLTQAQALVAVFVKLMNAYDVYIGVHVRERRHVSSPLCASRERSLVPCGTYRVRERCGCVAGGRFRRTVPDADSDW